MAARRRWWGARARRGGEQWDRTWSVPRHAPAPAPARLQPSQQCNGCVIQALKVDLPPELRLRDVASLQVLCRALGGARRRTLLFVQFSRPSRGLADVLPPAAGSARSHYDRERNGAWWFAGAGHRCRSSPLPHGCRMAHPLSSWATIPSDNATVALLEATATVPRFEQKRAGAAGGAGDALGASASSFATAVWREGGRAPAECHVAALFAHINREDVQRLVLDPDGLYQSTPVRVICPPRMHACLHSPCR